MLQHFNKIKTFVFDIDGVLTDGQVFVQENGTQLRQMNIKDGYALQLAVKQGYQVIIISGADNPGCVVRLERLGIQHVYTRVKDKVALLKSLTSELKILLPETIYMGDDMPDIAAMRICGLRACPNDAATDVRMISDYISPYNGGMGAARDIIEKVLRLHHKWC